MSLNTGHVLTTARLTLADITEADLAATYQTDRDPLVLRYIGDGTLNYNGRGEIPFFRLTRSDFDVANRRSSRARK